MSQIDLIWLKRTAARPEWELGSVYLIEPTTAAVRQVIEARLPDTCAKAWLFWDEALGMPCAEKMTALLAGRADGWHAGLLMGMGGQPDFIDFVSPTWMLNRDANPQIEATSWRLSLGCFLVRCEVLRQMGAPSAGFETLAAASLELGFRYIQKGVILRHCPRMWSDRCPAPAVSLPLPDQLWFLKLCFGQAWAKWAIMRAVLSQAANVWQLWQAWRQVKQYRLPEQNAPYQRPPVAPAELRPEAGHVSVLIPTINRYPYLRTLLGQLRQQTVRPTEILVVDQTPTAERDRSVEQGFSDLPLRWFWMDRAGQCSSRNLGFQMASGDLILFLDDDVELSPDVIEMHLRSMERFGVRVCSGVVHETDRPLPQSFTFQRASDVFPAGNSMICKEVLFRSGLFDLAFDHGQRADGDLGMRIYLCGELMILNPEINLLHHHAPVGGLREHKARVHTYAASRKSLLRGEVASVSDIYLATKYFSKRQVSESLWISAFGTFSYHGPLGKRIIKFLFSTIQLPLTIYRIKQNIKMADRLRTQITQQATQPYEAATNAHRYP